MLKCVQGLYGWCRIHNRLWNLSCTEKKCSVICWALYKKEGSVHIYAVESVDDIKDSVVVFPPSLRLHSCLIFWSDSKHSKPHINPLCESRNFWYLLTSYCSAAWVLKRVERIKILFRCHVSGKWSLRGRQQHKFAFRAFCHNAFWQKAFRRSGVMKKATKCRWKAEADKWVKNSLGSGERAAAPAHWHYNFRLSWRTALWFVSVRLWSRFWFENHVYNAKLVLKRHSGRKSCRQSTGKRTCRHTII